MKLVEHAPFINATSYGERLGCGGIVFAVAPMMDWTDRHCRFFHRQLTKRALLYTEMVVADAVIHGDRDRLIGHDAIEHPLALQLGGSDPAKLAEAASIAAGHGYDEINLNVGCPSDRVQSGTFGACLMREPDLVARCVEAMCSAVQVPVTVKCRIGVDEQDPRDALWAIAEKTFASGSQALWVHARKAWLEGLSPKQNRDIPPLDYSIVHELKRDYPDRFIGINGGIASLQQARQHSLNTDGVMLGRAAYQTPAILADVDHLFFGDDASGTDFQDVVETMMAYARDHIANGGRLVHVTRHMIGLFHGMPGARAWRRTLSEEAVGEGAGPEVLAKAFTAVNNARSLAA